MPVLFAPEGIPEEFTRKVEKLSGAKTLYLPRLKKIRNETAGHTDLALIRVGKILVAAPEIFETVRRTVPDVICGGRDPAEGYPEDIRYNAFTAGSFLFCAEKYTDREVLRQADRQGLETVNVKQGYAKCSTIPIADSALITSDPSIARAAESRGFDVLKVSNTGVKLAGFTYGFIGGASCVISAPVLSTAKRDNCGKIIVFSGDLDGCFPEASAIREFCLKYKVAVESCNGFSLYDYGSPLFLD